MRKVLAGVALSMALCVSSAHAQDALPVSAVALPGSMWISTGNVGALEPNNTLGQAGFEQGITVWKHQGSFLIPYVAATLSADSIGYDWNNKHPMTVGVKLQQRLGNGVLQGGGGFLFERDPETGNDRHPSAFVSYWAGWRNERGSRATWPAAFPGSVNATSGILTGRDPNNWMSYISAQQGVVVQRWHGVAAVPFAGAGVSFDTKRRTWQNRWTDEAGVKVVHSVTGGAIEAGVAQRHQYEYLTERSTSGPVAFVNVWIGWNPGSFSHR